MKQCPQCNRTYEDESLNFCLKDGATLRALFDAEGTVVMNPPPVSHPEPVRQKKNLTLTLALISVALIGLLGIVWWQSRPAKSALQQCVLYNDDARETSVMTRMNCDRFSCDDDTSTAIGSKPNGTAVERLNTPAIKSKYKKFNWVQVTILNEYKPTVWVADTKISCKNQ
jgi:hypothetical protein